MFYLPRLGWDVHRPYARTVLAGLVTSGGTASIAHAMLAYREHDRERRGISQPNVVKPETAHLAVDKACHLYGELVRLAGLRIEKLVLVRAPRSTLLLGHP